MAEVEPNNSHQNKEISNNKKKHLPKYAQFLLTGIAGAAIGAGAALIYATPFGKNTELSISPALLDGNGKGLCASLRF